MHMPMKHSGSTLASLVLSIRRVLRDGTVLRALSLLALAVAIGLPACSDSSTPPEAEAKHHKEKDKDKEHGHAERDAGALSDEDRTAMGDETEGKDGSNRSQDDQKKKSHGHDDGGAGHADFYVSMHGEKGGNTVAGLTANGELVPSVLQAAQGEVGATLRDLRGLCLLADNSLLVVNAWQQDTRIIRYAPAADGTLAFQGVFIQGGESNPALQHTYSIVLGPDGNVYCSNQDSNTVTRYRGPGTDHPGEPVKPPPSLAAFGDLPPGMFVPSTRTTPEGLHGVRGLAFGPNGLLYVADRDASRVVSYDPASGERKAIVASDRDGLKRPIQLAFSQDATFLFIGDDEADCVWRKDLDAGTVSVFVERGTGGLEAPSALLIAGDHLYVGNRKDKSILRFRFSDQGHHAHEFAHNLPDAPEFFISGH
jgi:hypothetical protein